MIKFGFLLDVIGSVIIYIFLILLEYAGWEIDDFYKIYIRREEVVKIHKLPLQKTVSI
jgi:hypothetical protein